MRGVGPFASEPIFVLWRQSGRFLHPGIPPMRSEPSIERCGAELLSALLLGGKMRRSRVFRYFLGSRRGRKRVVTAKPSSLDATPAQHNREGSAHFPDNRCPVLNWASSTKRRGARLRPFFLPDMYNCRPQFRRHALRATVVVIPPSWCFADAGRTAD
jgi:hypothetical protein